jgi:peroxiredoxin
MTIKMKHPLPGIILLVVILLLAIGYYGFKPNGLQTVPDINLSIVDGRTLNLKQLNGHPVLVVFLATSCPGCIREIPHLIELYHDLAPRGLEIVAIAMAYDPPNRVMDMRQRKQIPYPIALDIQGEVASAFGDVHQTPNTFLIDPQGQIVKQFIGRLDMAQLRTDLYSMLPKGD